MECSVTELCYSRAMPALTRDQVLHIAALARLQLSDAEVDSMTTELSSILSYIDMLSEVDTSSVEPTAQVTGQSSVLREDTITPLQANPDDLLACSPLPLLERQIQAPHAHG